MAATKVLLDTGPLVAYFNDGDQYHDWAVDCWDSLYDPLWTCESVISESLFCLHSEGVSIDPMLALIDRGVIRLDFNLEANRPDVFNLLRKYSDQPMSLADACLVRMAEIREPSKVFTTDKDFLFYRRKGRQVIALLSPFHR